MSIDISVFIKQNEKVKELYGDNEWLAALLSGEGLKEKKMPKKEVKRFVSNQQLIAIRGK